MEKNSRIAAPLVIGRPTVAHTKTYTATLQCCGTSEKYKNTRVRVWEQGRHARVETLDRKTIHNGRVLNKMRHANGSLKALIFDEEVLFFRAR